MAIMAASDLVESFGSDFLQFIDIGGAAKPAGSLLSQLLLKGSSNDKRFVIDEVQRTLDIAAQILNPALFLERLLPYAAHKSPKVSCLLSVYFDAVRIIMVNAGCKSAPSTLCDTLVIALTGTDLADSY